MLRMHRGTLADFTDGSSILQAPNEEWLISSRYVSSTTPASLGSKTAIVVDQIFIHRKDYRFKSAPQNAARDNSTGDECRLNLSTGSVKLKSGRVLIQCYAVDQNRLGKVGYECSTGFGDGIYPVTERRDEVSGKINCVVVNCLY